MIERITSTKGDATGTIDELICFLNEAKAKGATNYSFSKNLANIALLGNPEEVKPSGADPNTVIGGVAMKQELLFNIINN